MRFLPVVLAVAVVFAASAQEPASNLGADLQAKRNGLKSFHEEFQVFETINYGDSIEDNQHSITIDVAQNKWRERSVSGAGDRLRLFDGQNLFLMEVGGQEYVREKVGSKNDPEPSIYRSLEVDWRKAKELRAEPCGFAKLNHTCILIEAPESNYLRATLNGVLKVTGGVGQFAIDSETGLLIQSRTVESVENDAGRAYSIQTVVSLKRLSYGAAADPALFQLPTNGVHEVKELSRWDVDRIKKELLGKPAPDLHVTDIQGNPVSLSDLKGKTVLLDFWTSWCPPCREDAPALDKLYAKYGSKNLAIIGISVDEDRGSVENFLKEHPHKFPIVLSSENEMPRPYEIDEFPTYMVIAPDGTVATAVDDDQGFAQLRKFLQQAGMDTD